MRIVIIGTGNTATVLGKLFLRAGHSVPQIIGRNAQHAKQLATSLHSSFTIHPNEIDSNADMYVIAVTDNAITEIAEWLRIEKKIVVHTAGSVEKDVLKHCSKNHGVLYPLQSMRKDMDHLPEIPFMVDGNTEDNRTLLYDFAKTLSAHVAVADDQQRLLTHIGAVLASNFTNHLYVLTEDFCNKKNIDFNMLLPLIREVTERLHTYSPQYMQTGPAIRHDANTIEKHISALASFPSSQSLYRHFTESIQQWYITTKM